MSTQEPTPEPQDALLNLADYERRARSILPQMVYDYFAGGANDEVALADPRHRYDAIKIAYRVLHGVHDCDLSLELLGSRLRMPVLIAPTAYQAMAHPEGELATARAAGAAGTVMMLSTVSTTSMEDVAAATEAPVWFQLYMYEDPEVNRELLGRAERAGCRAIVVTADTPVLGRRERDIRNRFTLPPGLTMRNFMNPGRQVMPDNPHGSGLSSYASAMFKLTLSWDDFEWVCNTVSLPVLVKGVVRADDAREAVKRGAAGVIVSNHGGRQLDAAPATIDALPRVAQALGGRVPVVVDGGIRRGTDVVKALALGATAVAIGRPVLWGLAVAGEEGVAQILSLLREELELAMRLAGAGNLDGITQDLLEA